MLCSRSLSRHDLPRGTRGRTDLPAYGGFLMPRLRLVVSLLLLAMVTVACSSSPPAPTAAPAKPAETKPADARPAEAAKPAGSPASAASPAASPAAASG